MPASGRQCSECGSPLARDQRYCLVCGARAGGARSAAHPAGGRRPQELAPARGGASVRSGERAARAGAGAGALGLRLPSARVSALLVLAFLGFGVVLGSAAGERRHGARSPPTHGHPCGSCFPPARRDGLERRGLGVECRERRGPGHRTRSDTFGADAKHPGSCGDEHDSELGRQHGGFGRRRRRILQRVRIGRRRARAVHPNHGRRCDQAAADQARVRDHALRRALRDRCSALPRAPTTSRRRSSSRESCWSATTRSPTRSSPTRSRWSAARGRRRRRQANCPTYAEIAPASAGAERTGARQRLRLPGLDPDAAGQLPPSTSPRAPTSRGSTKRACRRAACAHPALGPGRPDARTRNARRAAYATFRNPFVYFHSITDSSACASEDVGLSGPGGRPRQAANAHPSFSYIVPDRCHDGNPTPCTPGAPAGIGPADGFLSGSCRRSTHSKAYKRKRACS